MTINFEAPKKKLKPVFQHLLFWFCYTMYEVLIGYFGGLGIRPLTTLLSFIVNAGTFYATSYSYAFVKKRLKNIAWAVVSMIGISTVIIFITVLLKIVNDAIIDHTALGVNETKTHITALIMRAIYFLVMGLGYAIFRELVQKEREVVEHELEKLALLERQQSLEKKALQAELNVIKSQINPHFVFNTLGFLYAETYKKLPDVGQAIITLSNIMRYALTKNEDGYSTLESELNYIRDFIKIHETRSRAFFMKIDIRSSPIYYKVVSLILVTLIENMFKHGIFNQNTKEAVLNISVENEELHFYSLNYKNNNSVTREQSNGIGLNYIRERLTEEYGPEGYKLSIDETHNSYECKLTMPLRHPEIITAAVPTL
jgi:two-component system LytT family sensor kinase